MYATVMLATLMPIVKLVCMYVPILAWISEAIALFLLKHCIDLIIRTRGAILKTS